MNATLKHPVVKSAQILMAVIIALVKMVALF